MREKFLQLILFIIFIVISISAFSQEVEGNGLSGRRFIDSLKTSGLLINIDRERPDVKLTTEESISFLEEIYQLKYWNDPKDPLRQALGQLIFEATYPPLDSSKNLLNYFPYDSLNIPWDKFYIWEPLRLKIPYVEPLDFILPVDSVGGADTSMVKTIPDSSHIDILSIPDPFDSIKPVAGLKDTTIMVIIDTLNRARLSNPVFPFRYLNYSNQGDSIRVAVQSLLKYVEVRDSSRIYFTGIGNIVTPIWLNSKSDEVIRYWLKNELSDSVILWIGNMTRDTIGLYLEQGITFRRPAKQGNFSEARVNVQSIDNSKLQEVQKIITKPQYWKYHSEAAFSFNQSSLTNWVKGGENSISTAMDITGYADFNNKSLKLSSNNFARLKLGFLKSGKENIRKNLDLLETNSKLNHKAFGKFDFSAILLLKTQIARGYSYTKTDTILVSKLLNPTVITAGFGLDYKPNKETSLNLSPLSYKGTFVSDTLNIDQTKYGILRGRKSKNEPGASFMISHVYKPFKKLTVTNRLQLFTNYINNPLNIDIDWEMIAVANLNWFTDVRINAHLIFDDDTKTVELNKDGSPVLRPDGTKKKTARAQFKEMIGFSFVFRF